MTAATHSLFSRPDTLLGVCEGLGQDFGFNPLYLRVALAVTVFWSPLVALSIYLALGVAVLASRLTFPRPTVEQRATVEPAMADNDDHAAAALSRAA